MKKLLIVAGALTLAVAAAQAAPAAKDPMCSMAAASGNSYSQLQSWGDRYGCWGGSAKPTLVAVRAPAKSAKDPMCSMGSMSGSLSWAQYYHCW